MIKEAIRIELSSIARDFPSIMQYLHDSGIRLPVYKKGIMLGDYLRSLSEEFLQEIGMSREVLLDTVSFLFEKQAGFSEQKNAIESVTIQGGQSKSGEREDIELTLLSGSVTGIVGPTGSGKSRLLADIEWLANRDTPTYRKILINGKETDPQLRFSLEHKMVAQLSQNMNFVMDTTVGEFIRMHAESRFVKEADGAMEEIIRQANELAGEPFSVDTPLTGLSGGQSRALMIADTAFLSTSPIVLIDEIENAGIDRKKALALLVKKEKIILIATHDPILALLTDRRIVIKNGGIFKIIETSPEEKKLLGELEALDNRLTALKNRLRIGEQINGDR